MLVFLTINFTIYEGAKVMEKKIEFTMILNQFDEEVMNSFPQKLVSVKKSFFGSKIVVQNESTHLETESFNFVKEKGQKDFLKSSVLVDYENPLIKECYKNLKLEEMNNLEAIKTALQFVKTTIQFDMDLAKEIGSGKSSGRCASKTLEMKKGTCGECVNLFAALMRLKSIPCKFISGLCLSLTNNRHSLHAWAEVYDENLGWIPVCPQSGGFGVPRFFVKTHQGLDFDDTGAKFSKLLFKLKGFKEIE